MFKTPSYKNFRNIIYRFTRRKTRFNKNEDFYKSLFEQSPNASIIIDPQTTLPIEHNELVIKLLGYSRQEFANLRMDAYEVGKSAEEIKTRFPYGYYFFIPCAIITNYQGFTYPSRQN